MGLFTDKNTRRNTYAYIMVMVGMISAFGPFVTDFYLPALPDLSRYFNTSTSLVQMTLTAAMIGLGAGQLVIGPLSDRYGRKRPLLWSMVLFTLASVGCLMASDITTLLAFRLVQGVAGSGGVVIARSIAVDLYSGRELAKSYSIIGSINGIAPICAPMIGGLMLTFTDWHGIFTVLLALGIFLFLFICPFRESNPVERRGNKTLKSSFSGYLPVLRNVRFLRFVSIQTLALGSLFAYIASSPFIFREVYGMSAFQYSLCFGLNSLGIMIGSLIVLKFRQTINGLRMGNVALLVTTAATCSAILLGHNVWMVEAALFFQLFSLGMIFPTSTTLAMAIERDNSGVASAIVGAAGFLLGGIISPLTGMGDMALTSSIIMGSCSILMVIATEAAILFHRR